MQPVVRLTWCRHILIYASDALSTIRLYHCKTKDRAMSNWLGKQLGDYLIRAPLGAGGMAEVYRATHQQTLQEVALKLVKPELNRDGQFLRRFMREVHTLESLHHPHILRVHGHGEADGTLYLVMELLPGGDLAVNLRHGAFDFARINRYSQQIADGLSYAHSAGIIHRDLKPQNILLNAQGDAVITDFGLAKLVSDADNAKLTQSGTNLGTPAYMAPEQWRGEPADVRSDVYSLGVIVFEMFTGESLFRGDTPYELMHKHIYVQPPELSKLRADVPTEVDRVLQRALAKDRSVRWASADAFADALAAALRGEKLTTTVVNQLVEAPTVIVSADQLWVQEQRALAQAEMTPTPRTPARSGMRVMYALPQDVAERFVGRARQVSQVEALIAERARLISIYGRSGVGKTALACKIIHDLQFSDNAPDGVVALSTNTSDITLERILNGFGRMLGGDAQTKLDYLARDAQVLPPQKVAMLLDKLNGGRYILFLDHLEPFQDPTSGELIDPELRALFEVIGERGGAISLLITTREPLSLPRALKTWERQIALDEGLPKDEAVALMRRFDPDGAAGLRDCSDNELAALAAKTGGYPRALEAVAGLLLEDPLLTPQTLMEDPAVLGGEITSLRAQAMTRLPNEAVRVMQALAIFGKPVNQAAVEFLLAPHMNTAGLRPILARLVRGYFATFNKATSQFSLPAMDCTFCYAAIPQGTPEDTEHSFSRIGLHRRAAGFFAKMAKPRSEWRRVDDLSAQLHQIDQLVSAGDYDQAAAVLLDIDYDYLWEWGQMALLADLHTQLDGKVKDRKLARQQRRRIGWLRFYDVAAAEVIFRQILEEARRDGDRQAEADALDDLAQCARGLAKLESGADLHKQALAIYREIGDRRGEGDALGGIGSSLRLIDPVEAHAYLTQALAIHRELNNIPSLAFTLNMLGQTANYMGNYDEALGCFAEILEIAETSPLNQVWAHTYMGESYTELGDFDKARTNLEIAQEMITRLAPNDTYRTGLLDFLYVYWGFYYIGIGQLEKSIEVLEPVYHRAKAGQARYNLEYAIMYLAMAYMLMERYEDLIAIARGLLEQEGHIMPIYMAIGGVMALSSGAKDDAANIFEEALADASQMQPFMANYYAKGLAQAGLATLGKADISIVLEAYREALAVGQARGGLILQQRLIETLMKQAGGAVLAPVHALLVNALQEQDSSFIHLASRYGY